MKTGINMKKQGGDWLIFRSRDAHAGVRLIWSSGDRVTHHVTSGLPVSKNESENQENVERIINLEL